MKITKSYLRQIIKEELSQKLDEMPYAGTLRGAGDKDIIMPGNSQNMSRGFDPKVSRGFDPKVTTRLIRSSKFQNDAVRLYAKIPFPVWLAPIFSEDPYVIDQFINTKSQDRIKVIDLDLEGLDYLTSLGFDGIEAINPGGDLVIVVGSPNTIVGVVTTPWKIWHAILDSFYDDNVSQLDDVLDMNMTALVEDIDMSGIDIEVIMSCMTMFSAREGQLNGQSTDVAAEMVCQELIDKRGVYFNFDNLDDPETQMKIEEFGARAKEEARAFRRGARGKLIFARA